MPTRFLASVLAVLAIAAWGICPCTCGRLVGAGPATTDVAATDAPRCCCGDVHAQGERCPLEDEAPRAPCRAEHRIAADAPSAPVALPAPAPAFLLAVAPPSGDAPSIHGAPAPREAHADGPPAPPLVGTVRLLV